MSKKGKFERCVRDVKAKGSAYDPRAVCAAMERKKYGQKELTRRAVAGKRRAARGNLGGPYAKRETATGWEIIDTRTGSVVRTAKTKSAAFQIVTSLNGKFLARGMGQYLRNPAESAAEAYKIFHGEAPSQFTEVTERIHYHANLWSVGTLIDLTIRTIDRTSEVTLSSFKGAFLAANEQAFKELSRTGKARAQLFVKGGDQSVPLEKFGIDPDRAHEVETLGRVVGVNYETNKVHLGDEGGEAVYHHKFRRTREGDAEVKVHWARYPDVIYRVLDRRLEFSGGSYELIAEGINL